MNKLEKLIYRKNSLENLMSIWGKGIEMYSGFIKACEKVIDDKSSSEIEIARAKKEIHEAEIPYKHYISSWKLGEREYNNHIIPEIEKNSTEEEREGIDFKNIQERMKELSKIDLFGTHSKLPDNVELVQVSKDIKEHIELLESLVSATAKKVDETDSDYEKAKGNLDIFKMNLQITTNKKRLEERNDYYYNTFKPKYDEDMKEADMYLDKYLDRAKSLVKLGVDVKLSFLLDEYEKNKEDREKVWLFYTALKSRLNKIFKEMRKNKSNFKGKMHLAKAIN